MQIRNRAYMRGTTVGQLWAKLVFIVDADETQFSPRSWSWMTQCGLLPVAERDCDAVTICVARLRDSRVDHQAVRVHRDPFGRQIAELLPLRWLGRTEHLDAVESPPREKRDSAERGLRFPREGADCRPIPTFVIVGSIDTTLASLATGGGASVTSSASMGRSFSQIATSAPGASASGA
jgi:hypothetical protein